VRKVTREIKVNLVFKDHKVLPEKKAQMENQDIST
jgi:hypothetical protein